jgi:hypothetical protein
MSEKHSLQSVFLLLEEYLRCLVFSSKCGDQEHKQHAEVEQKTTSASHAIEDDEMLEIMQ